MSRLFASGGDSPFLFSEEASLCISHVGTKTGNYINTLLCPQEPFEHESLLLNRKDHKLTKAEKKAAKKSYEEDKRTSVPYTRPSYAQYYPASDQSLTSIPAFSQRNW